MSKQYVIHIAGEHVDMIEVNGVDRVQTADATPVTEHMMQHSLPSPIPVERVVATVFAGVSVVLLIVAVVSGVLTARHQAREVRVAGHVVSMTPRTVEVPRDSSDADRRRGGIDREYFYPVVEFVLPDGTKKQVQTAEGSWPPAYETGQAVTVLYDGNHPLDARIESAGGTLLHWTWTLITGALGLAFATTTVLIRKAFLGQSRGIDTVP